MDKMKLVYKYCCGCGLCSKYLEGGINNKGYYRPENLIGLERFDTSMCYCNQVKNSLKNGIWGNFEGAFYSYAKDEKLRKDASSGGMLTAIACYLLDTGKVNQVVQIATAINDQMKTEVRWNTSSKEVRGCCGSRYTASASLEGLLDNIDINKKYAVIGKPCDIRVLRAYVEKNKELNDIIVYLFSFFCGGTPSIQANDNLLIRMGLNRDEIKTFTYRGNGWPGKTTGIDNNDSVKSVEYEESWGQVLGRDLQEICRFCWEGVGEAADISCGDGWHIVDNQPSFEERDGRNVVFSRNDKGNTLLLEMYNNDIIQLEQISEFSILKKMQPGQLMRKGTMFSKVLAMRLCGKKVPQYSLYSLLPYAKFTPLDLNIRVFLGTIRRVLTGKIE